VTIQLLRITGLRNLGDSEIQFSPGLNVFAGPNGAGKTSVLEAVHVLSTGKSFRSGKQEHLINHHAQAYTVFGEIRNRESRHRIGLERKAAAVVLHIDGKNEVGLARAARLFPVAVFEPDSHQLLTGGTEARRQLLDWMMFHVEPGFFEAWSKYRRALRQRNALLKHSPTAQELAYWNELLAAAGECLAELRASHWDKWQMVLSEILCQALPGLGASTIHFRRGWNKDQTLAQSIADNQQRDLEQGHTGRGPHRADWSVQFEHAPTRESLSRGQQKAVCFAAMQASVSLLLAHHCEPPVLCLDDLFSELDMAHQSRCLAVAESLGCQVLVTGTSFSPALETWQGEKRLFHVKLPGLIEAVS
jgi:DNA replication and repair protein RecF